MKPQQIVVTGGAGFIGTHLCERLTKEGHRVISVDNYFTGSKDNHIPGVEYREGHTKDIEALVPETPDIIFHLGEYSRVEKSFSEPDIVWDLNIAGTFGIAEFWRKKHSKLIYAGSSTKFGDNGTGRDQSPYAWTKATNTEFVRNYAHWFSLPFAITYFYNVYGPGERSNAYGTVIEIFKQKYLKGEHLSVVSPGTQQRNFTHVHDIVDGLIKVAELGDGDGYNLGNERAYSIIEVAKMFKTSIEMLPERPGNRMGAILDTSKVKMELGWEAERSLTDYIEKFLTEAQQESV